MEIKSISKGFLGCREMRQDNLGHYRLLVEQHIACLEHRMVVVRQAWKLDSLLQRNCIIEDSFIKVQELEKDEVVNHFTL